MTKTASQITGPAPSVVLGELDSHGFKGKIMSISLTIYKKKFQMDEGCRVQPKTVGERALPPQRQCGKGGEREDW